MTSTTRPTGTQTTSTLSRGGHNPEWIEAYALTVLMSPDAGRVGRVHRLAKGATELGRQTQSAATSFDDPRVSRVHACITWNEARNRFLLADHNSKNGTVLNGEERTRELLSPGDIIRIGDTVLRFGHLETEIIGWSPPKRGLLRGGSLGLRRLYDEIEKVADSELSVLITGETGCGKELVAQEIHRQSGRPGPFRAINCAAIPADLMESELFGHRRGAFSGAVAEQTGVLRSAAKGSVFLDEVGELPLGLQAKLLRVLDERRVRPVGASQSQPIDVRFISATNRDLASMRREGEFRSDLLARLDQWPIQVPPLRDRPEDIVSIFQHVMEQHGKGRAYEMSGDYIEALVLFEWPANVRELISLVRRGMVILKEGGRLELDHLPRAMRPGHAAAHKELPEAIATQIPPEGEVPTAKELQALLRHYAGNVSEIARHTGRDRKQVYRWLRRHGFRHHAYHADAGRDARGVLHLGGESSSSGGMLQAGHPLHGEQSGRPSLECLLLLGLCDVHTPSHRYAVEPRGSACLRAFDRTFCVRRRPKAQPDRRPSFRKGQRSVRPWKLRRGRGGFSQGLRRRSLCRVSVQPGPVPGEAGQVPGGGLDSGSIPAEVPQGRAVQGRAQVARPARRHHRERSRSGFHRHSAQWCLGVRGR